MRHGSRMLSLCAAIACVLGSGAGAQTVIEVARGDVVANGTVLPSGATVNVTGGTIGLSVDLSNGTLNISSGSVAIGATGIGTGFTNSNNSVTITGGNVGPFFQMFNSQGDFRGGTLDTFGVFSGSTVELNGADVTGFPDVFSAGTVNIRAGDINTFRALTGSTVNIFGTALSIGGVDVDLQVGQTFTITQRNTQLEATLTDGSLFTHALRTTNTSFPNPDIAVSASTITFTMTEPPSIACNPADLNSSDAASPSFERFGTPDGSITPTDFAAFAFFFQAGDLRADLNSASAPNPASQDFGAPDGLLSPTDFSAFAAYFAAGCPCTLPGCP